MRVLDLSPLTPGESGHPSPGLALLKNKNWIYGDEALAQSRLEPQSLCSDLWDRLSLDPLMGNTRRALLAVDQIRGMIRERNGVWMALAPDCWAKPALQVFLGVAKETGLDVRLMMQRAAAVAALSAHSENCRVMEWSWNGLQEVILELKSDGWHVTDTRPLPEGGVFDMYRRDAQVASDIIVARTRVDPMETGASDQRLFNSWWKWRMEGEPWVYESEAGELTLSEDPERYLVYHRDWRKRNSLMDGPEVRLPAALKSMFNWQLAQTEPSNLGQIADRFEQPRERGTRWKSAVPADAHQEPRFKPGSSDHRTGREQATHVLVDSVARPCSPTETIRVGQWINLETGGRGMGIKVEVGE